MDRDNDYKPLPRETIKPVRVYRMADVAQMLNLKATSVQHIANMHGIGMFHDPNFGKTWTGAWKVHTTYKLFTDDDVAQLRRITEKNRQRRSGWRKG